MREDEDYVRGLFEEYYHENAQNIRPPPEMEKREYGFLLFKEGVMVRHKAFKTQTDLHTFIEATVPAHAYNSTAYYLEPEKDMSEKKWQGADLTFDVDADHIATPCKSIHDVWICKNCKAEGRGPAPDNCPKCEKAGIEEYVWLCETCLERAKEEVVKLLDFLMEDFGFSMNDVSVCFSGHRGYHVHLRADDAKDLDSDERKEIVDYVMGAGFDPNPYKAYLEGGETQIPLPIEDRGWRLRIARGLYEILSEASEDELKSWGISPRIANTISQRKDELASFWIGEKVGLPSGGVGPATWMKILPKAVERTSAKVDTVVTTDIHRLIRIPETLNAKTGFKAAETRNVESFDPFSDAIVFRGEETVYVRESPEFRIVDQTLGPYLNKVVTIPRAAAVLLVAKGKASFTGDSHVSRTV